MILTKSPQRFTLFTLITFIFLLTVWHRSPWVGNSVYERIPPFSGKEQQPIPNDTPRPPPGTSTAPTPASAPTSAVVAAPPPASTPLRETSVTEPVRNSTEQDAGQEKSNVSQKSSPPWVTESPDVAATRPKPKMFENLSSYMKSMLDWPRPNWIGHWPPFDDYVNKDYDPNRWEYFPM